ncbi:MAG: roadblock/LC7 domain-containing protein [Actinomycetota bacterium]|nr:roadblock/LC7 domain-containing protein [Actinomycetota bacterium]
MHLSEPCRAAVRQELVRLIEAVPNITGVMVASADGHPIAFSLQRGEPTSIAAILASALGIGHQVADLLGPSPVEEATVRSRDGYVAYYAVGHHALLCVMTASGVNLARVHLDAREVTERLRTITEPELGQVR